jgi:hypothetical protein
MEAQGNLLYLTETAYIAVRLLKGFKEAEEMRIGILKCKTCKEIEKLINKWYEKL